MMRTISIAAFAACSFPATLAHAADDDGTTNAVVAPVRAWELTLGQGYSQGFGEADKNGPSFRDLSAGGPSLQLGFGYRINPRLFVGVYAEGARFMKGSSVPDHTEIYSAAAGVQGQWHFLPFSRIDPWVSIGTGYRAYWVDRENAGTHSMYGLDLARVRIGADYQLGRSVRIGPMIGGTLTVFEAQEEPSDTRIESIDDPGLSTFVFAGMQGRFEIGGQRVTARQARMARR
jgi:outer membrane protein W